MRQYDAGHTSYNPAATVPAEVETRWRYTACKEIDGMVTVADQHVYPGRLIVDATTGSRVTGEWTAYQQPAVVDGTLFVGGHQLKAYDAGDATHLWTFAPAGEVGGVSAPTVHDGTVYIAGNLDDPTLYAVDADRGTEQWQFSLPNDYETSPAVVGDFVYAVDEQGIIYKLDAATGDEQWRYRTDADHVDGIPTVANETIYLSIGDGTVVAVNSADGTQRWRVTTSNSSCAIAVTEETVFLAGSEACLALSQQNGTERWRTESATGDVCSVASNAVLIGGRQPLHALSRADGSKRWSFQTRSVEFSDYTSVGIIIAPAVVDDVVVVATRASDIYMLGPATESTTTGTDAA